MHPSTAGSCTVRYMVEYHGISSPISAETTLCRSSACTACRDPLLRLHALSTTFSNVSRR